MPPLPEQDTKLGLEEEEEDISFSLHANLVCTSFGSLCGTKYRFLSIAISPGFALVSASLISPFYPNHYYFVNFLSCFNLLDFFASILIVSIIFGALFRQYKYRCMALNTTPYGLWKRLRNRLIYHG